MTRDLPTHITRHPAGLLVRVRRGDVTFQAFIGKSFAGDPLAEAIRHRDRFLAIAGPRRPNYPSTVRSNTGIGGISETTVWRDSKPYPVFSVDWSVNGRHFNRRVPYGTNGVSRTSALSAAMSLRRRMAGPLRINHELTITQ